MTSPLRCHYCQKRLDPNGSYYRHVAGWEKPGRGLRDRSGSSLVLREPIAGEVACNDCIVRLQNGVAIRQESLL